ncbi:MAG TPA: dihydrofolate reductase family protein [Streptosporangiaceae bacterium]|nr:dihydrofolate reductase family protein [Streptosporangiaceae bacterium]
MTKVVLSMSMSLDGIAGPDVPDEDGMALFEEILGWVFPLRSWRAQQGMAGGEDTVDSKVWQENFDRFGPQVIGRRMFDYGYPSWGENPPFHAPVFVTTHRGQDTIVKEGGTSYTFVTGGLAEAVEQARAVAAADGKDVLLAGGVSIAHQALEAGLAEEVVLHLVPRLAGRGLRLFDTARADLRLTEAIQGEGALHLRYEVRRPS